MDLQGYYIIFKGDYYYPSGGTGDLVSGVFDTEEEAKKFLLNNRDWDWAEIVYVSGDGLIPVWSS